MEIIVGKQGNQPFPITDPKVSRKHLKITALSEGKYQIEDLASSNGTFVDGLRVIKKVVTAETVVQLGGSFTFRVGDAIPKANGAATTRQADTASARQTVSDTQEIKVDWEVIAQFEKLKRVYDEYMEAKITLQKENAQKGFMRMLPMSIMGIVGIVIGCVPALGDFRLLISSVVVVASGVLLYKAYSSQSNLPEKMEALNRKFQVDYVCPKCKGFLGFTPFEGLRNRKQCPMCKAKWVKE